jgi:hypothetical protein
VAADASYGCEWAGSKSMRHPLLLVTLAPCCIAAPTLADPLSISGIVPELAANQKPTLRVTLTEPRLEAVLVLRNSGEQSLHVVLATTPLVREDNGQVCGGANGSNASCEAVWQLEQAGAWMALPEVADIPLGMAA